jgi:hypothetical protein
VPTAPQRPVRAAQVILTTWHVPCSSCLASHAGQPRWLESTPIKHSFNQRQGVANETSQSVKARVNVWRIGTRRPESVC